MVESNDNCSYTGARTFEWDENKRQSNLRKHAVDFNRVKTIFDGRPITTVPGNSRDEVRFATTGEIGGRFYTVIWTLRGDNIRLISARRARRGEERAYRAVHG